MTEIKTAGLETTRSRKQSIKSFIQANKLPLAMATLSLSAMAFVFGYLAPLNEQWAKAEISPLALNTLDKGEASFFYGNPGYKIRIDLKEVPSPTTTQECKTYEIRDQYGNNFRGVSITVRHCSRKAAPNKPQYFTPKQ